MMKKGGEQSMTKVSLITETTKKSKSKSSSINYEEFYTKYKIPIDIQTSIGNDDEKFKILLNEVYKKMLNHYKELSKNPYDKML
jgi:hypothetical protein